MELIAWANENNGFLTLLLALISTISTVSAVVVSYHANKISLKNLKQAVEIEKGRNRPYIIFDVEHSRLWLDAKIKNLGPTAAVNISITIEPSIETCFGQPSRAIGLLTNKISFLAPGRSVSDLIGIGHEFYKKYPTPVFSGEINYSDSEGKSYKEVFSLDLTYIKELASITAPDIGKELEKLVKEVHGISKKIK